MHNPEKLISGVRKGELKKKRMNLKPVFSLFFYERIRKLKVENVES